MLGKESPRDRGTEKVSAYAVWGSPDVAPRLNLLRDVINLERAVEAYLEECLRKWTPPVGSQGVMEEALLSLLHDSDYELDAARREHARLMEASIAGGTRRP